MELEKRSPTMLFLSGGLAIVFGLIASFWPLSTALALVILWGAYALVDGVSELATAFRKEVTRTLRVFYIVAGVIGVLAGLFAIFRPVASVVALSWVLGVWLIVRGIMEVAAAFVVTSRQRWILVVGGILWIIAGVIFTANPGVAALALAMWPGILAIGWGILLVGAGLAVRSMTKNAASARHLPA